MTLTDEQIKAGWTPWHGGDKAPDDWDGGDVLWGNGRVQALGCSADISWHRDEPIDHAEIIGYRRKSPDVSPELVVRMVSAIGVHLSGGNAEPEFRAIHAEIEPVDPLLVEAREVAARLGTNPLGYDDSIRAGKCDNHGIVRTALAALKRGIELAGEQ